MPGCPDLASSALQGKSRLEGGSAGFSPRESAVPSFLFYHPGRENSPYDKLRLPALGECGSSAATLVFLLVGAQHAEGPPCVGSLCPVLDRLLYKSLTCMDFLASPRGATTRVHLKQGCLSRPRLSACCFSPASPLRFPRQLSQPQGSAAPAQPTRNVSLERGPAAPNPS